MAYHIVHIVPTHFKCLHGHFLNFKLLETSMYNSLLQQLSLYISFFLPSGCLLHYCVLIKAINAALMSEVSKKLVAAVLKFSLLSKLSRGYANVRSYQSCLVVKIYMLDYISSEWW